MSIYQEIILDHYQYPHNHGHLTEPNYKTKVNNPLCGDEIEMEVNISNNQVEQISFFGHGCAISQASASILTDFVKGKSVSELQNLQKDSIMNLLGIELSPNRLKCALISLEALHKLLKECK
ncbi:MAG: SUF system NifU family Fe-S cluster assembly protein [Candidatus Roizmanbacteria bacterium]